MERLLLAAGIAGIVLPLLAVVLLSPQIAAGTPPRRRALAIGAPIALVFLATQIARQLRNMRDRLDALHGRLEITTAPGRGSVVAGTVPVA